MHLTFLNLPAAIIAAAITVPALLFLYFLKLRRRPIRVSSTLLWQQATRDLQVNVPFRLIRPTWLLFLQLLVLLLFLAALARPSLNMGAGTPQRIVLVIDRSASMNARDGATAKPSDPPRTRLDEAKDRAGRTLEELTRTTSESSFAVVELAAAPRVTAALTQDRDAAREAINAVQPTDQPGDLATALRLAAAMLADEPSELTRTRPGRVILFSDGGFPPPPEGFILAGADFRFERVGQPDPIAEGEPRRGHDNLGIVALAARRDWEDPSTVRIFVRIRNANSGPVAAPLVLSVNGQEVERQPVEAPGAFPSRPAGAEPTNEQPETIATFSLQRREGGIATVSIDRPDLLDADNSASLVLDPAAKPRILLITPTPPHAPADIQAGAAPPAPSGPEWIISEVLRELQLPTRTMTGSAYEREISGDEPPTADVLIFDRVSPTRVPAAASLSFGAGLPSEGVTLSPAPEGRGTYILTWDRAHPLLRHVALDSVFIARPMPLRAASNTRLTELARGAPGPLITLLESRGIRRVIVAFEPAYSNWPLTAGFPIFLAQTIDFLSTRPQGQAGRFLTTAEPAELDVAPATSRITLTGPQRIERSAADGRPGPGGLRRISLGLPDRAGVYRVEGAPAGEPNTPTAAIAVNVLDPTESSLTVADQLRIAGETIAGAGPGQEPTELWPWLIAAAAALLTLEWFLNAVLMRV